MTSPSPNQLPPGDLAQLFFNQQAAIDSVGSPLILPAVITAWNSGNQSNTVVLLNGGTTYHNLPVFYPAMASLVTNGFIMVLNTKPVPFILGAFLFPS